MDLIDGFGIGMGWTSECWFVADGDWKLESEEWICDVFRQRRGSIMHGRQVNEEQYDFLLGWEIKSGSIFLSFRDLNSNEVKSYY